MMENIPNAIEARRLIERGEYEKASKQAEQISLLIQEAISEGKCSISGEGSLEMPVIKKLEEKDYKCKSGSQYNENYWSISW